MPVAMLVTGWAFDKDIPSTSIEGLYQQDGTNHGRPTFWRHDYASGQSAVIYYWDARDGFQHAGWWSGPAIGRDPVWAFNPSPVAAMPPKLGWHAPPGREVVIRRTRSKVLGPRAV